MEEKTTPGLQSRIAVVYPLVEVMRQVVQRTTKKTKQNKHEKTNKREKTKLNKLATPSTELLFV